MSRRTREELSSVEDSPERKQFKMANENEEPTIQMVYQLLLKVQTNTSKLIEDNKQVQKDVQDLKKALSFQDKKVDELSAENKKLKDEVTQQKFAISSLSATVRTLNNQVSEIETQQDNLNQYNRKHNLIITGVPEHEGEDVQEAIKELGDLVNAPIDDGDIDIVHRLNSKSSPRPIIVKFLHYSAKRDMYAARKKLKSIASQKFEDTNCLYGASRIFINENLTSQRGSLFAEVRKRAKMHHWHSTWTLDGKIYVRKYKDERFVRIEKQVDLEDLYPD